MTSPFRTASTRRIFDIVPRAAFLVAAAAAALLTVPTAQAAEPTVATTTGTFTAVPSPSYAGVDAFFGIRYAAPPTGALRWAPPQAPVPPSGTVVASTPGNICPQSATTLNEDCLFLNVYVPASATPASKLPVFFWIHGGALVSGAGSFYDPTALVADNNIIAVTINYRLGALGWLAAPGLQSASANSFEIAGDTGNYGLMDQQFAMQWVQANIARFGGDPTKVTIAGESAGGLSVSSNLASPYIAPGLFRGAIIESGGYMDHSVPSVPAYESKYTANFDAQLGCTSSDEATCLRSQSVLNILTAQSNVFGGFGISPAAGTLILPQSLQQAFSSGEFVHVPVLQGSNANEGRLFETGFVYAAGSSAAVAAAGGPANYNLSNPDPFCVTTQDPTGICGYSQETQLIWFYLGYLGAGDTTDFANLLTTEYPLSNFPDPYLPNNAPSADEAVAQEYTDFVFSCQTLDANTALAQWVPVYAYEFNDPNAPAGQQVIQAPNDVNGYPTASEHSAELQFLFSGSQLDPGEEVLSVTMIGYWGNFVQSGTPNAGQGGTFVGPTWPQFNSTQAVQNLVPDPATPAPYTTFGTEHFCSTWEPFYAN